MERKFLLDWIEVGIFCNQNSQTFHPEILGTILAKTGAAALSKGTAPGIKEEDTSALAAVTAAASESLFENFPFTIPPNKCVLLLEPAVNWVSSSDSIIKT